MWPRKWWLQDTADSGDGSDTSSGGGGNSGTDDQQPDNSEMMKTLTNSVGLLARGMEALQTEIAALKEGKAQGNQPPADDEDEEDDDPPGEVNLEQMDRKQFAQFLTKGMIKAVRAEIAKSVKDVDTKVASLAEEFQSKNAEADINSVAHDNPDFFEWSPEIRDLLKSNPTLSVKRAYTLAKAENPEKVKKLGAKYNPPKPKGRGLIGLTPTSSRGSGTGNTKMGPKEAAEKAFDQIMATIEGGDALLGDDNIV